MYENRRNHSSRKLAVILLSLVMVVTMMPMMAFADEPIGGDGPDPGFTQVGDYEFSTQSTATEIDRLVVKNEKLILTAPDEFYLPEVKHLENGNWVEQSWTIDNYKLSWNDGSKGTEKSYTIDKVDKNSTVTLKLYTDVSGSDTLVATYKYNVMIYNLFKYDEETQAWNYKEDQTVAEEGDRGIVLQSNKEFSIEVPLGQEASFNPEEVIQQCLYVDTYKKTGSREVETYKWNSEAKDFYAGMLSYNCYRMQGEPAVKKNKEADTGTKSNYTFNSKNINQTWKFEVLAGESDNRQELGTISLKVDGDVEISINGNMLLQKGADTTLSCDVDVDNLTEDEEKNLEITYQWQKAKPEASEESERYEDITGEKNASITRSNVQADEELRCKVHIIYKWTEDQTKKSTSFDMYRTCAVVVCDNLNGGDLTGGFRVTTKSPNGNVPYSALYTYTPSQTGKYAFIEVEEGYTFIYELVDGKYEQVLADENIDEENAEIYYLKSGHRYYVYCCSLTTAGYTLRYENRVNCPHYHTTLINWTGAYSGDYYCNDCESIAYYGHWNSVSPITNPLPLKKKQSVNIVANLNLTAGDYVTSVSTSNAKIATVNGVTVKGKKKGSCYIYVGTAYGLSTAVKVKVQNGKVKGTIYLSCPTSMTLARGQAVAIGAWKTPVTCTYKLKYSSSKKKVASVGGGVIYAKKKGSAKIYVKCGSKKKTIKVKVV